jgi:beta-lactam-binding protein with PASTA domain
MSKLKQRVLAFLGLGKVRGRVEVPRLTGLRVETARERCLGDGLLFSVEEPALSPSSVVVGQSPAARASVSEYTTVRVRVAMARPRWHPRPWRWWVRQLLGGL